MWSATRRRPSAPGGTPSERGSRPSGSSPVRALGPKIGPDLVIRRAPTDTTAPPPAWSAGDGAGRDDDASGASGVQVAVLDAVVAVVGVLLGPVERVLGLAVERVVDAVVDLVVAVVVLVERVLDSVVAVVGARVAADRHRRAVVGGEVAVDVNGGGVAGAEAGGVVVAGDGLVVVADHVAVAADVAVADLVVVAGDDRGVLDVVAGSHRAVAGRDRGVDVDVLVEVAAVGVDLLVHRVVGDRVAVVDVVVGDVRVQVADPRLVVRLARLRPRRVRGRRHVHVVAAGVVLAVEAGLLLVAEQDESVAHVLGRVVAALGQVALGVVLVGGECV